MMVTRARFREAVAMAKDSIGERVWDAFTFRFFPAFWAGVFVAIGVFSSVPLNLLVVDGRVAAVALYGYAVALFALAAFPVRWGKLHPLGAALAVLVLGGRAGGFVELAFDRESWALVGAILERCGMLMALLIWHRAGMIKGERERQDVAL